MKRVFRKTLHRLGFDLVRRMPPGPPPCPPDIGEANARIYERVKLLTMTSPERVSALVDAVRYTVRHRIPGDFVECGVWKGGSAMAAALALQECGEVNRTLYLYDTYQGMSAPGEADVSFEGERAVDRFAQSRTAEDASDWCRSPLDEVRANVLATGYPAERIHFVEGKVEDTIPATMPARIAILRLDTDWYASTRHELVHLFPRLVSGGVLIIDDYGHWQGARRAVDEYLVEQGLPVLLQRIDYTGRIAVKP